MFKFRFYQLLSASSICVRYLTALGILWGAPFWVCADSNYKGVYIGGTFGGSIAYGTSTINSHSQIYFPDISNFSYDLLGDSAIKAPSHISAAFGSFNIGYGINYLNFFNGIEFFVSRSLYNLSYTKNSSFTHNISLAGVPYYSSLTNNIQSTYTVEPTQIGVDLRPGYIFQKNSMLYARVGVVRASVSQTTSFSASADFPSSPITTYNLSLPLISAKTSSIYGVRAGGGFEYLFFPQFSCRFDYVYTNFGNPGPNVLSTKTSTITNPLDVTPGTLTQSLTTRLKSITDHAITLGVNYYFAAD